MSGAQLTWLVLLLAGVPLGVILLSQWADSLRFRDSPFATFVERCRDVGLSALAVFLFFEFIVVLPAGSASSRLVATLLGVALTLVVISFGGSLSRHQRDGGRAVIQPLVLQILRVCVAVVALGVIASFIWNIEIGRLLTALGLGSAILALALQDALGNLVNGLLLLVDRPFSEGDWVRVGRIEGKVLNLNWRSARVETRTGDVIVMPNGVLGKENIVTLGAAQHVEWEAMEVALSIDFPPNAVKQTILELSEGIDGVRLDVAPEVRVVGYGDTAACYEIRIPVVDYELVPHIRDAIYTRLWYGVHRRGQEFPTPRREHYRFDGEAMREVAEYGRTDCVSALRRLPAFEDLDDEEARALVAGGERLRFGRGEWIRRFGERHRRVDVVLSGEVSVTALLPDGRIEEVERLGTGDIFGDAWSWEEPSGVPGASRAVEDVDLLRLGPTGMEQLARARPHLAEQAAAMQARRDRAAKLVEAPLH